MIRPLALLLAALAAAPTVAQPARPAPTATAVFAGGCFWSVEHAFEHMPGVVRATSGYSGGARANPTYGNHEGHLEAVQVVYDPRRISYRQLVDRFWRTIDPTDDGGQFCDQGAAYRTAVFTATPQERAAAEQSRAAAQAALGQRVVTPVRPVARFWVAEGHHQDFAARNAVRYRLYRVGCGRDARLRSLWGAAPA